jgi:pimeloyl-ACP methyl ester carboxylesterase
MIQKLVLLFLIPTVVLGQSPEQQGLKEFKIPYKKDTVHFYIYKPDSLKNKVFLYLQGSSNFPMINADENGDCCNNNYPKSLMKIFPKDYAFVYIQKIGLPFYVKDLANYSKNKIFYEYDNVEDRANIANEVVNYLSKRIFENSKVFAVLGHSEGGDVAAKLSTLNKKITHLCFASCNGTTQAFTDVLFTRRKMLNNEITALDAQKKLSEYYLGLDSVFQKPNSTKDYFRGNNFKWHSTFNQPPIENLLKLKIPIFLTIGSADEKVPIESSDFIVTEFIRLRKTNLTEKVYLNCNHGYIETSNDGIKVNRWNELFMDFIKFVEQKNR